MACTRANLSLVSEVMMRSGREVLEEVGLTIDLPELIGVYHAAYKDALVFHYLCATHGDGIVIDGNEIGEAAFFGRNSIPANMNLIL